MRKETIIRIFQKTAEVLETGGVSLIVKPRPRYRPETKLGKTAEVFRTGGLSLVFPELTDRLPPRPSENPSQSSQGGT